MKRLTLLALLASFTWIGIRQAPTLSSRVQRWWEGRMSLQFREDATRSAGFLVERDEWVEFDIPRQTTTLRILTNAAINPVAADSPPSERARPGWRYAIDYELLDKQGNTLLASKYHFRVNVVRYQDVETEEEYTPVFFQATNYVAARTRTMQLAMAAYAKARRLRLRMSMADDGIEELVARPLGRVQRQDYDKPYLWTRITRERREKLCRANVYTPDLMSPYEQRNLLRWQWMPLPPIGMANVHFHKRLLYSRQKVTGSEVGVVQPPQGVLCEPGWPLTVALPAGPHSVRVDLAEYLADTTSDRSDVSGRDGASPGVHMSWYGRAGAQDHRLIHVEGMASITLPRDGGLLEFSPEATTAIRVFVRRDSTESTEPDAWLEVTPEPRTLRAFSLNTSELLEYEVCHVGDSNTPLQLAVWQTMPSAEQESLGAIGGFLNENQPLDGSTPEVRVELLDRTGAVIDRRHIAIDGARSEYDHVVLSGEKIALTESTRTFFSIPPGVARLRVATASQSLLVTAFTRPPGAPHITRVPEDYNAFERAGSVNRIWYVVQPNAALELIELGRTTFVRTQSRPPEVNEDVLAGNYQLRAYEPEGNWRARYVLTRQEATTAALRERAFDTTYWEYEIGQSYHVHLLARLDDVTKPRCIYAFKGDSPSQVALFLDGKEWHRFQPKASRGEVTLPDITARTTEPVELRVEADQPIRLFIRHVMNPNQPRYLKRFAQRFTNGCVEFTYSKNEPGEQTLILRPMFSAQPNRGRRQVLVKISPAGSDAGTRQEKELGPHASWTVRDRLFDIASDLERTSIVLGVSDHTATDSGMCLLRLHEDMPCSDYKIRVQLLGEANEEAYTLLYQLVPGREDGLEVRLIE